MREGFPNGGLWLGELYLDPELNRPILIKLDRFDKISLQNKKDRLEPSLSWYLGWAIKSFINPDLLDKMPKLQNYPALFILAYFKKRNKV
jgi:hypothetical protein